MFLRGTREGDGEAAKPVEVMTSSTRQTSSRILAALS
jgi:hypothetical protein